MAHEKARPLRARLGALLAERLSPERIRRATLIERLTVRRLDWVWLERSNRWLALLGKVCTVVWIAFFASAVLGVDWRSVVEHAVNSGRPVKNAVAVAILVPTLLFVAIRSAVGYCRWRIQRELWRRDVERLSSQGPARAPAPAPPPAPAAPPSAPAEEHPPRATRP
jgi:hypothetical protein